MKKIKNKYFTIALIFSLFAGTRALGDKFPFETIYFKWKPAGAAASPYKMEKQENQHRIILFDGVVSGNSYPVVIGFHGQPKRGRDPSKYFFAPKVIKTVSRMIKSKKIPPIILVLPVFRFKGQNWPEFSPKEFKDKVEKILKAKNLKAKNYYAFGHSGAAGCGGNGLNIIHKINPKAVGFFDTCLGSGWIKEISRLEKRKINTVNIHSVETAGFRPRQRPEYQSWFDFGKAYKKVGMAPCKCPLKHPGKKLRDQKYKCAADSKGFIKGFVVDTGSVINAEDGIEAHKKLLPVALEYFLSEYIDTL